MRVLYLASVRPHLLAAVPWIGGMGYGFLVLTIADERTGLNRSGPLSYWKRSANRHRVDRL